MTGMAADDSFSLDAARDTDRAGDEVPMEDGADGDDVSKGAFARLRQAGLI